MDNVDFKMTQDWMLVEVEADPEFGKVIQIPDTAVVVWSKSQGHKVVAMGPWRWFSDEGSNMTHGVEVGDTVIIEGMEPQTFEYLGKRYTVVRARYVVAIVNKP